MSYINEPDHIDFTVVPKHLTTEEANEISTFIAAHKAKNEATTPSVVISPSNLQELDFLLALLKKLNVQWSLK